jgi:hypothetical protein
MTTVSVRWVLDVEPELVEPVPAPAPDPPKMRPTIVPLLFEYVTSDEILS